MIDNILLKRIEKLVLHQLENYWGGQGLYCEEKIINSIPKALHLMELNYSASSQSRFYSNGELVFDPLFSVTWMIFLYRLSRVLYLNNEVASADCIYYLNKIMHSVDWFYQVVLPEHFMAEHPIGSVLGKAKYGDKLFVYQGTTIGGNRKGDILYYPIIGDNVLMYANSTVLGDTVIGNNVIISAHSYLINENIPDNCVVFGVSPNIVIKKKSERDILDMTSHLWK